MAVKKHVVWTALDTLVSQGGTFLFRLILAKVLAPEQFGLIAMTLTTVAILQIINDFGFTAALIQKDDRAFTKEMVDSVFAVSLLMSAVLFVLNWFAIAPLSGFFFDDGRVATLTAFVGISLLFAPFSSICRALLYREFRFKEVTIVRFVSTALGLVVGLVALYVWRSVWAFVFQIVIGQLLLSIGLLSITGWKPRIEFSRTSLRELFGYSSFVFLNDLAVTIARNLDILVIGRILSAVDVGLYSLAFFLTDTVRMNLMSVLNRVMFVHYAKAQNDMTLLRASYLRTMRWNCLAIFPLMTTLALFGPSIAIHWLGQDWRNMAPVMQLLSISVMIHAAGGTSSTLYKAIGRPGLDMTIFLLTTAFILVPALFIGGLAGGMVGVAFGVAVAKLLTVAIRQLLLDQMVGSTLYSVLMIVVKGLVTQLPTLTIWYLGFILWEDGGWVRDIILGTISLVIQGGLIAYSQKSFLARVRHSPA